MDCGCGGQNGEYGCDKGEKRARRAGVRKALGMAADRVGGPVRRQFLVAKPWAGQNVNVLLPFQPRAPRRLLRPAFPIVQALRAVPGGPRFVPINQADLLRFPGPLPPPRPRPAPFPHGQVIIGPGAVQPGRAVLPGEAAAPGLPLGVQVIPGARPPLADGVSPADLDLPISGYAGPVCCVSDPKLKYQAHEEFTCYASVGEFTRDKPNGPGDEIQDERNTTEGHILVQRNPGPVVQPRTDPGGHARYEYLVELSCKVEGHCANCKVRQSFTIGEDANQALRDGIHQRLTEWHNAEVDAHPGRPIGDTNPTWNPGMGVGNGESFNDKVKANTRWCKCCGGRFDSDQQYLVLVDAPGALPEAEGTIHFTTEFLSGGTGTVEECDLFLKCWIIWDFIARRFHEPQVVEVDKCCIDVGGYTYCGDALAAYQPP